MVATRPDIAYIVGMLSRFLNNPGRKHWEAAKRVLRYLALFPSLSLSYTNSGNKQLIAYWDSDWGSSDFYERKSISGYACLLADASV